MGGAWCVDLAGRPPPVGVLVDQDLGQRAEFRDFVKKARETGENRPRGCRARPRGASGRADPGAFAYLLDLAPGPLP